jgi:hypothetical protein
MTQSGCRLSIKLDNNQNAIYSPGQLISGWFSGLRKFSQQKLVKKGKLIFQ